MKTKFTPGPWVARNATLPNSRVIRWVIIAPPDGFTVADTGNAEIDKQQDEANARLIAAAPELLEAAKLVLMYLETDLAEADGPVNTCATVLADAIEKATGEDDMYNEDGDYVHEFTTIWDLQRYISSVTERAEAPPDGHDAGVRRLVEVLWGMGVTNSGQVSDKIDEDAFWKTFEGAGV